MKQHKTKRYFVSAGLLMFHLILILLTYDLMNHVERYVTP